MLAEWLKHLTTPCPGHLKAMGYLKELIAIQARHRRCQAAWAPHLEQCRKVIGDAASGVAKGRVVVLGSGLLLDVPLEELARIFDDVALVDIFHMPEVEERVRGLANVRLVTEDLSGVVEPLFRHMSEGRTGSLPPLRVDAGPLAGADLVVSANLLTQLPLLPMGLVREKGPKDGNGYGEEETRAFARRIIDHHLDLLTSLPGRVALLTETERVISDGDEILQSIDPLFGATLPPAVKMKRWTWDIALRPEITRHIDLRFRMAGIADFQAGGA